MFRTCSILWLALSALACADEDAQVLFLGNAGVAVFAGDRTLLFDPLFNRDYGHYSRVPDHTRAAIFAAEPPFDTIHAVFISHHHEDHFDPAELLRLLARHKQARLYAPQQAVEALQAAAGDTAAELFDRITAIDLSYEDAAVAYDTGGIGIQAFFVPHAGWPTQVTDVQNIAFRVRIDGTAAVAHLGDADPNHLHFEKDQADWDAHPTQLALPPYWFFNSTYGNRVLGQNIRPLHAVGIHVPKSFADARNIPAEFDGYDLLITPGETRAIPSR